MKHHTRRKTQNNDWKARRVVSALMAAMIAVTVFVQTPVTAQAAHGYEAVFDAAYYSALYPDLKQAYGTNEQKLLNHFLKHGMAEGRQASAEFNVLAYAARYSDLQKAFGADLMWYYYHYINFGKKEGRNGSLEGGTSQKNTAQTPAAQNNTPAPVADRQTLIASHPSYAQAAAILDAIGWDLQAAFNWSSSALPYYGHGKPDMPENGSPGTRWFATFGFTQGKGNCYVMAATFCEMARLLGYGARQMDGYVRNVRGGLSPHSWVEIDLDGQTYVFDPDYTYARKKSAFKIQYGQKGTWQYQKYTVMAD